MTLEQQIEDLKMQIGNLMSENYDISDEKWYKKLNQAYKELQEALYILENGN